MKTLTRSFFLVVSLLAAYVAMPSAQQYTQALNNTTLSAAVNASQTTMTITSASAITGSSFGAVAAGQFYFVDQELGRVNSIASTTITVSRATRNPAPHANAARIFFGAAGASNWQTSDPPLTQGAGANCPAQPYPWINTSNGNVWVCRGNATAGIWGVTNAMPITYNSVAPGLPA